MIKSPWLRLPASMPVLALAVFLNTLAAAEKKKDDSDQDSNSSNTKFDLQQQSSSSSSQSSTGSSPSGLGTGPASFGPGLFGLGQWQISTYGVGGYGQDSHQVTEEHTVHVQVPVTEIHFVTETSFVTKTIFVTKTTFVSSYDSHLERIVTTAVETQVPVKINVPVQTRVPVKTTHLVTRSHTVKTIKNDASIQGGFGGGGAAAGYYFNNWLGAGVEGAWFQGRESSGTTMATLTARLERNSNAYYVFVGSGEQFDEHHTQTIGEFGVGIEHHLILGASVFGDAAWMFGAHENAAVFRGGFRWSF